MLEIILIFILPVVVVWQVPFFYKHRSYIFTPIAVVAFYLILRDHSTLISLGLRFDNFNKAFGPYLLLTVLGGLLIVLIAKLLDHKHLSMWWKHRHFQVGFILVSILQELLYRSYLIGKLSTIFDSVYLIILINSVIFSFIHIIYPHKIRNLTLSFVGGLAFASIYYYLPNLILISITHSVFNFLALLYGLIGPNDFKTKTS